MKNIIVFGGSGGIGFSIVHKYLTEGQFVISTFKNNKFEFSHKNLKQFHLDITDNIEFEKNFNFLLQHHKPDIIVYSIAETIEPLDCFLTSESEIWKHLESSVFGLKKIIDATQEIIKMKSGLKFIVILSEYCFGNTPERLMAYTISKYALLGMCKALSRELIKYNSTVHMVSPSIVETNLVSNVPKKALELNAYQNPLKRNISADEIANLVVFLSSSGNESLNGSNIVINGGNKLI